MGSRVFEVVMFKKEWCFLFSGVKVCTENLLQKVLTVMEGCEKILEFVRRVEFSSSEYGVPVHLLQRWSRENGIDEDSFPLYMSVLEERGYLYRVSDGVFSSVPSDVLGGL